MSYLDTMSLLDRLPPSPPTTTSRKATAEAPSPFLAPPIVMSTPEDSPASIPGSSNQGSRKKVEFRAQPNIHSATVFVSSPEQAASMRPLPPSREHRPGGRSILKTSGQKEVPLKSTDGQQEDKLSVNQNVDSIVQQLSKNDKPTSLDAYNTLASLFRAYDDLPEAIGLKNRLSIVIKYIRRDLATQDQADEAPTDTNLVLSALKLLIILVWNTTYSPLLSDDAKTFILDRSIHVISIHSASKNVIVHYLHLLSTQNFRPNMMAANNRAARLLDALKDLPNHVSSSAVMSETIMVLGRLTDQARPVMKSKADCWVEILLTTMMTSSRDTRQKALSFGMKACSAFATAPSVSAAFRDMLGQEMDTNTTIEANACKRLKSMLGKPDDAVLVPQIWATVLLLAVNVTDNVSEWRSFRSCWLEVIKKCFNSSEAAVRKHANFAWNRLVCLARPHQAPDDLASLLGKPIAGQMERSGRDKQGNDSRTSALSCYCNLLYYAFRPAATHKQYTRSWNEYIVKILGSSFFGRNLSNPDFACRIFMAFTWNPTRVTKVWKDTRAHDNAIVEPEELPTIDAKWLRKNCGTVLQMFKLLFTYSSWTLNTTSGQVYVAGAWKHFAKSLGDAASKEIKASPETTQACAQVVRLVQELWKDGPRAVNASNGDFRTLAERLNFLLRVVIAELGAAPFIDVMTVTKVSLPAVILQTFASTAVNMGHALYGTDSRLGGAYLPPKSTGPTLLLLERTLQLLDKRLLDAYNSLDLDQRDMTSASDLLSACLRDTSQNVRILALDTMKTSLRAWLEDTQRSSVDGHVKDTARSDTARMFANVVIPSLGSLPSSLIESFDGLFAAGFSSTHKDTINQMIDMWNITHGQVSQKVYGPNLSNALNRLRPYVDIELVDFPLSDDSYIPEVNASIVLPAFLNFTETQSQLATKASTESIEEGQDRCQNTTPHDRDCVPPKGSEAVLLVHEITTSRPQSSHSTPRRGRRHNDSQVQFQQINSSPLNTIQAESQYLTERQKEVRDRQRQDASVYFSDPRPDIAPKPTPNISPSSGVGRQALRAEERPYTPTLPGRGLVDFDSNPTTSPTPRSKHQALRLEDIDAPSSPLSVQADEDIGAQANLGTGELREQGPQNCQEMSVEEDGIIEYRFDAISTELQKGSSMHKGKLTETTGEVPPTEAVILVNGVAPTTNDVLEDLPHITSPEREYDSGLRPATHEVGEAAPESVHYQSSSSGSPNDSVTSSLPCIDSDELDMMSQSQLSQDLESHISEHGDTPKALLTIEEEETHLPLTNSSAVTGPQKKRKRCASLYAGSKRRKSRSLSRSLSIASQEEPGVSNDCIEVDTSTRIPLAETRASQRQSQVRLVAQMAASDRESSLRRDPTPSNARVNGSPLGAYQIPTPVLPVPGSAANQKCVSAQEGVASHAESEASVDDMIPENKLSSSVVEAEVEIVEVAGAIIEQMQDTGMAAAIPKPAFRISGTQAKPTTCSEMETGVEENAVRMQKMAALTVSDPQQHGSINVDCDIMNPLKDVLETLKHFTGQGLDLRSLEDLCFHIRTEGQNASSRWASH